ncbi:MAG: protein kinase [Acidobacteriota bacterium]
MFALAFADLGRMHLRGGILDEMPEGVILVVYVIIGVVAYYVITTSIRSLRGRGGGRATLIDWFQRTFFKNAWEVQQARRLAAVHNYLGAGEAFERLEMWEDAIKVYTDGREYAAAAVLHEKLKQIDKAIICYLQARDHESAANLALSTNRPLRAAEIFEHSSNWDKAAEVYLQLQNYEKAAELLERSGAHLKAAQTYEKAGNVLKAAKAYEKGYEESRGFTTATAGGTGLSKESARMAVAAATLYDRTGETAKSIEICTREKLYKEAAQFCAKAKRYKDAAKHFAKISSFDKAAEMLELGGESTAAAAMRAEGAIAAGKQAEAASWFEKAGDFVRAAELYEWEGMYRESAACFVKNESFLPAAEAYLRANDREMAASMYERGNDFLKAGNLYNELKNFAKAAELLEIASSFFDAGMAARDAGDDEKALVLLQKVPPPDEHYLTACTILGKLFVAKGQFDLAIDRYMKATADQPIQSGTIELYYLMAEAVEKVGRKREALTLFKKIGQEDYSYRDVRERIRRLEEEVSKAPPPGMKTTGQIVAPAASDGLERYELLDKIGEGGMGMVYKAQDKILKRLVALKILSHPIHSDQKVVDQFFTEARSAAALNHPNIVTVFDVGRMGKNYFISMEYVEGEDFMMLLEKWKRLTVPQFVFLTRHLCQALDYAHKQKIIHRDIKPTNIMLTKSGQIKLMDFGLAKILDESEQTQSGAVSGTPYYMSPEQIQGKKVDHRTDIYSLGASLYHLLVGHPPFHSERVLYQHLFEKVPPPTQVREDLPAACDKIMLKCLQKEPERRYKNAIDILEDLKAFDKL